MPSVATGSTVMGTPTTPNNAQCTIQGSSYSGFTGTVAKYHQWGVSSVSENSGYDGDGDPPSGGWTTAITPLVADKTYLFRVYAYDYEVDGTYYGSTKSRRTGAMLATASAPASSNVGQSTATISCLYYPNCYQSTATVWLEYKKTTDSTWTTAGSQDTGKTGYSQLSISRDLSGLDPSTQYQFRLQITRSTVNNGSFTSSTSSFTTEVAGPTLTTENANGIGFSTATLNATVNPNDITTDVTFEYGTSPGVYGSETSPPTELTGDTDQEVTATISVSPLTTYYFRVKGAYSGGTSYGSELSFTTPQDPGVFARNQEMLQVQDYDRKWGVATTIFFNVPQIAASSSDSFYTGAAPWIAGDVKRTQVVYNDSKTPTVTGPSNTTNLPAQVSGSLYRLDLEAAEMQADDIWINLSHSATVRDVLLRVRTHQQLGSAIYDSATGQRANWTAFKTAGYGSGHGMQVNGGATGDGLQAVGGASGVDIRGVLGSMVLRTGLCQASGSDSTHVKLDSGAPTTAGFFVNAIILIVAGTGAGVARVISAYDTNRICTVAAVPTTVDGTSRFVILQGADVWNVSPGAELTNLPTYASGYGAMVQMLFQRFAYRIDQDANTQKWYKSDAATIWRTKSCTDGGSYQSLGMLS